MPKAYNPHDKLLQKAKFQGYRARSVYKLQEIDEHFKLLQLGMKVLDIGAAPGSWLQYTAEKVGPKGQVVGLDLQQIAPVASNVKTFSIDIKDQDGVTSLLADLNWKAADIILSDIAPNTTGIPGVDAAKSVELSKVIVELAQKHLKNNGSLVMKVFQGQDFERFYRNLKDQFRRVTTFRAQASRDRSKEIYVLCSGKKVQT